MNVELHKWDIQDHLKTDEDINNYLNAVLEEQDNELLLEVLKDISIAKNMTKEAQKAGLTDEVLNDPASLSFPTVIQITRALGIGFHTYKLAKDK